MYCSATCDIAREGDQRPSHVVQFNTKVVHSRQPKWNSSFEFWTSRLEGNIVITVKKRNWFWKSSVIGTIGIPLQYVQDSKEREICGWFDLPSVKKKNCSTPQIFVSLHLLPASKTIGSSSPNSSRSSDLGKQLSKLSTDLLILLLQKKKETAAKSAKLNLLLRPPPLIFRLSHQSKAEILLPAKLQMTFLIDIQWRKKLDEVDSAQ